MWEITGAEFSKSTTHTADGISIRFPRVTRIRDDKDWKTANDLPHLKVQYLNICLICFVLFCARVSLFEPTLRFVFMVLLLLIILSRRFCSRTRELQPVSDSTVLLVVYFKEIRFDIFFQIFRFGVSFIQGKKEDLVATILAKSLGTLQKLS